jgi:hypothetical protein
MLEARGIAADVQLFLIRSKARSITRHRGAQEPAQKNGEHSPEQRLEQPGQDSFTLPPTIIGVARRLLYEEKLDDKLAQMRQIVTFVALG